MQLNYLERYQHKLVDRKTLLGIIKTRPRQKQVIMCHGVFDVVHPGHVRHLTFAKSYADILVVSITADEHINKDVYRPNVPGNLRALNLAAFEAVDYVLIDKEPSPIANLTYLQPDFFAKGFEYSSVGLSAATQEEADTLAKFGGQLVFTPGDIIYSSSRLINASRPRLEVEKLLLTMELNKFDFSDLRSTVRNLSGIKVHVVGDTIVDTYTRTVPIGANGKTPTLSVLKHSSDDYVGGAGVVAKHLRTAGADVTFTTVLGDDELQRFVVSDLEAAGIVLNAIIDTSRPTTNKNTIVSAGYRLLKIDTLDNREVSGSILGSMLEYISTSNADIVLFSDFRHGIFNKSTIPQMTAAIREGSFRVADSQVASRWGNITEFVDFDLVTPNEKEARFALADQDSTIGHLSGQLIEVSGCKTLMLKLGERGVFCLQPGKTDWSSRAVWVESFVDSLADAVGAGDALLAYATLALKKTGSHAIASVLGSIAAACECEIDGNEPIHPESVLAKIDALEQRAGYSQS